MGLITAAERGWLPDWLVRVGIRRLLAQRLREQEWESAGDRDAARDQFADQLRSGPLAVHTDDANSQHYEVPADFFLSVLGPRLKYSCCWFPDPSHDLARAEEDMLRLTCERAELEDGMSILELGCGWGSLTIWMGEQYPTSQITAISNSHGQREFIERQCRERGLTNIRVITADMRDFDTEQRFTRVVSVEMFEHMRNYHQLLRRISDWLQPDGKLFVHIFCHRRLFYLFETEGEDNWMGRHFFSGGVMPSDDLLEQFQDDLSLQRRWQLDGMHYWRTCEAWLKNLDANRRQVEGTFAERLSPREVALRVQRWRMFFMACAELFRYGRGQEWIVSHYLFENRPADYRPTGLRTAGQQAG